MSARETTDGLVRIVSGFNKELAQQLQTAITAERNEAYYLLRATERIAQENRKEST